MNSMETKLLVRTRSIHDTSARFASSSRAATMVRMLKTRSASVTDSVPSALDLRPVNAIRFR